MQVWRNCSVQEMVFSQVITQQFDSKYDAQEQSNTCL